MLDVTVKCTGNPSRRRAMLSRSSSHSMRLTVRSYSITARWSETGPSQPDSVSSTQGIVRRPKPHPTPLFVLWRTMLTASPAETEMSVLQRRAGESYQPFERFVELQDQEDRSRNG